MNSLWTHFQATPQVSSVLPNLLPSFRLFLYRSLSRRLVYFITFNPLCQPLFSLSAFFTLYFPFLISFCPFCLVFVFLIQKVTTERRSVVTLYCLLYLDKKINSQNKSSVSYWRRHPDLNWGSRCCRPMPYHLAIAPKKLERITRLELATSTLARWRSTGWATPAYHTAVARDIFYAKRFKTNHSL